MSPELAQLLALRAQLDAIILCREVAEGIGVPVAGCSHPEEMQRDASTGGTRRTFCLACNTEREA